MHRQHQGEWGTSLYAIPLCTLQLCLRHTWVQNPDKIKISQPLPLRPLGWISADTRTLVSITAYIIGLLAFFYVLPLRRGSQH